MRLVFASTIQIVFEKVRLKIVFLAKVSFFLTKNKKSKNHFFSFYAIQYLFRHFLFELRLFNIPSLI